MAGPGWWGNGWSASSVNCERTATTCQATAVRRLGVRSARSQRLCLGVQRLTGRGSRGVPPYGALTLATKPILPGANAQCTDGCFPCSPRIRCSPRAVGCSRRGSVHRPDRPARRSLRRRGRHASTVPPSLDDGIPAVTRRRSTCQSPIATFHPSGAARLPRSRYHCGCASR